MQIKTEYPRENRSQLLWNNTNKNRNIREHFKVEVNVGKRSRIKVLSTNTTLQLSGIAIIGAVRSSTRHNN